MTLQEFTSLLVDYIIRRKISGDHNEGADFSEKIWTDIKRLFGELATYVDARRYPDTIKTICKNPEFRPAHLQDTLSTFICMEVGNIFYYMEGLNTTGTAQSSTDQGEGELWNYLRCIIGTWTLMKLHGNKCNIREITTHVSKFMGILEHTFKAVTNRHTCAWVKFEELKIGTRLMGEAMEQWVTAWQKRRAKVKVGNVAARCGHHKNTSAGGDEQEKEKDAGSIEILRNKNLGTVRQWMDDKEYLPKSTVTAIIGKIQESNDNEQGKKILNAGIQEWEQARHNTSSNAAETSGTPAAPSGASEHGNTGNAGGTSTPATAPTDPATKKEPTEKEKEKKKEEGPPAKVPEVPKTVSPDKNTPQAGSGPDSKGRNDEGLPDALPQPPSAAGAGGQQPGQGPGPGQQPPPPPPTVKEGESGVGGKKEDVETVAQTPPKGDAKTDDANTPAGKKIAPKCEVTTQTQESSGVDKSGNVHSVAVTFNITPTAPECSGSGTSGDQKPQDTEHAGSQGQPKAGTSQAPQTPSNSSADESKDSKNTEGTVQGGGTTTRPSGVDTDKHCTQKDGNHDCDLKLAVPFEPTIKLWDGHFGTGPTPGSRGQAPQNVQDNGPFLPDLTGTVLTATTPILFFLSAVIVALLEVLNECEAAAWDTVKDDYLQILVEEFMGGNNTCTSSSDVCTPDDGLATQELATDPCPPNEDDPDPWRCMETIPLATDTSPPNEDNHDPCSGMESIQLATDTSPPNEEDPDAWSCMENIQLETDTSPPNEDDPDPWSCMETIQLATDPSPPNACDPWNCMETIPLETHPCPPNTDHPDRWSSMETIQLATDPSPPNNDDPDPWSCMESIQSDAEHSRAPSVPGDATSACTQWIHWIDRHKHLLRECMTQPWFNALKTEWKQYLLAHMAANEDNGVYGHSVLGEAATLPMKKLDLWKQWVSQQHRQMSMYNAEEWCQHLLHNVEEATESHTGHAPIVENDLDVENVMGAEDVLSVRDVPRTQLHKQPDMQKTLTAKIWILILALVIEECEVECRLQDRELYVDELLDKL
ncbi:hypothetical protein AK88_05204 [Plasmodium fragile]|uniref:Schizont-infected cell agglutination extracellular alpha domain-containing protein n=1 Tax=Plasmodium fragile TaxID=5857 RepID=A0A0D9QHI7_PLAFR|nr:uncharacterized protein AK88_05204 [Plasmodium fragile]KJP85161.1 hypothetical protein AK88_05204 [Plasmodium fragile]